MGLSYAVRPRSPTLSFSRALEGEPSGSTAGPASTSQSLGPYGPGPATARSLAGPATQSGLSKVSAREKKARVGWSKDRQHARRQNFAQVFKECGCPLRRAALLTRVFPCSVGRDLVASQFRGCTDL